MAQTLIFLDYTFLFDTTNTFQHLFEFEKMLGDFLDSKGYQAEVIKSIEGSLAKRVLYITKKEIIPTIQEEPKTVGRPITLKGQIKRLSDRKFRKPAQEFMKGK